MYGSRLRWLSFALAACGAMACSDSTTQPAHVMGSTPGWYNGQTVTFDYTQDFTCANPPSSGATSKCELGAAAQSMPSGDMDTLWVMTPLGFRPPDATLHCPTVGSCVTHPATIDLSRVFGAGTEQAATPAHSHIIDQLSSTTEPWPIVVVGVTDSTTWNQIVAGKSLTTVRNLQAADPNGTHITPDIPTNLFLYFSTR